MELRDVTVYTNNPRVLSNQSVELVCEVKVTVGGKIKFDWKTPPNSTTVIPVNATRILFLVFARITFRWTPLHVPCSLLCIFPFSHVLQLYLYLGVSKSVPWQVYHVVEDKKDAKTDKWQSILRIPQTSQADTGKYICKTTLGDQEKIADIDIEVVGKHTHGIV